MIFSVRTKFFSAIIGSLFLCVPLGVYAANVLIPNTVLHTVAFVVCDNRQGSGVITKVGPSGTFVVTNGHVALDTNNNNAMPTACRVGIVVDDTLIPQAFFHATVVRAVFNATKDIDFAVLRLGAQLSGPRFTPSRFLTTNEFAQTGQTVYALGYPSKITDSVTIAQGKILNFRRGSVLTNVEIAPGFSGGPVIDENNNLIGIATRISYVVDVRTGVQNPVDYEMGDVLGLINWLDTFGSGTHDLYMTHAPASSYDSLPFLLRNENPPCLDLARLPIASTVYCVLADSTRFVFPNTSNYFSWYRDYSGVQTVSSESLASSRLVGNVTYTSGTLVKIQTDPKVYLVANSVGLLRLIPSEQRASALFGTNWAAQVVDVPDVFFVDYTIGAPIL